MSQDLYEKRLARPMLLTEGSPFNSKDYIFELKFDGIRALAYLEPGQVDLRNKRNKWLNPTYPELNGLAHTVQKRCIIDGELVIMSRGKPDFYTLQKRSLLTDPYKIERASKRHPVLFIAYDILYVDGKECLRMPLLERKALLAKTVQEGHGLVLTQYIEEQGITLFEQVKARQLEGIIAKKKDSIYQMGIRSKNWLKIKHLKDADFIICGVIRNETGGIKSLRLALYDEGQLIDYGSVAMGISRKDEATILQFLEANRMDGPPYDNAIKYQAVEWMVPELVCTVKFMAAGPHGLRQPTFKGLREDKDSTSCTTDQLIIEYS